MNDQTYIFNTMVAEFDDMTGSKYDRVSPYGIMVYMRSRLGDASNWCARFEVAMNAVGY